MDRHLRFDSQPTLLHPALVCAFQGWNDGGEAASVAARYLMERWEATRFAGIVGVLHEAANRADLPSVSLWAAVPHYLPVAPNPKAALALVERACGVLGTTVDTGGLGRAVGRWELGVARLLEENEELGDYA